MNWYFTQNGGAQQGPVSQDELTAKLASGELRQNDLVWREGMAEWVAASSVPELRQAAGGSPMPQTPVFSNPYQTPQAAGGLTGEMVPNYLWQSIVVTLICCLPFGIPAIIYASKVDGLMARGDFAGAREASKSAKMWCWVSFGVFMALFGIYILMVILGVAAGLTSAAAEGGAGF
ncbi:CD225/dispanin family protein [Prosthecobacter sp. SYSU 5D2]|uniref:CD225/dispanin family protein n=1 Tax=Prosthecobacter sp. SYSU 5D2 TaxID=3134134 RepID=UPI0031FE9B85